MALPGLREEFAFSNTDVGYIISTASIVCGLGKLLNGYFSDKANARYFLPIGLIGSAVMNFYMGMSAALSSFIVFWSLSYWFQSMGSPPIARLFVVWFSPKVMGTKWSIWSCSHQIGGAIAAVFSGYLVVEYGWRAAFIVPGFIAIVISIFVFNRVRDTPGCVGLPPVKDYQEDETLKQSKESDKIVFRDFVEIILKNKLVWYISLANLFLYIPRIGVCIWAPTFLKEFKGADLLLAGGQLAVFHVAAVAGGLTAGWVSDRYFQSRRGPVGTLYLIALSFSFIALWLTPPHHPYLDTLSLIMAGFFVSGPQVLVGIAMSDFTCKRVVGSANGFAGFMAYVVGAIVSGVGIGYIVDRWSWNAAFILFTVCSLIGAFCFFLTWHTRPRNIAENST